MTRYIDTKHVAAALRRRLATEFPGAKFSVRCGRGTGSSGIDVSYTDGPDRDAVDTIAATFKGSSWDSYHERHVNTGRKLTVTIDGKEVTGEPLCDSVIVQQDLSDEVRDEAGRRWSEYFDGADWRTGSMNDGLMVDGEWIHGSWPENQVGLIARKVILPARWAAAQAARAETAAPAERAPAEAPQGVAQAAGDMAVTIAHTYTDGTTVAGTRRRDGAAPILRGLGFDWKRPLWVLPDSVGRLADPARVEAVAVELRAAGFTVTTDLPAADSGAPEAYRGVPVPPAHAAEWEGLCAATWREGVDAALVYAVLAKSCDCGGCADCMTG
ncbi:hypothetical protein B0E38_01792 [Streptomyces sp. 111WW2]|uniref:LPD29 domain-containing protein n=1 Tax=Streptomyces sp. 111WW2 TaxID=1945515 RepID=UPI000D0C7F1D|nr:LPD29 domain-containing protein [Streptomyces sp. 111WW2]PSK57947.1 hypothetical protein B0E38_01792 [Streptomyces sp. 111WW2]